MNDQKWNGLSFKGWVFIWFLFQTKITIFQIFHYIFFRDLVLCLLTSSSGLFLLGPFLLIFFKSEYLLEAIVPLGFSTYNLWNKKLLNRCKHFIVELTMILRPRHQCWVFYSRCPWKSVQQRCPQTDYSHSLSKCSLIVILYCLL